MKTVIATVMILFVFAFGKTEDNLKLIKINPVNVTLENGKSFSFAGKGATWSWDDDRLNFTGEMKDSFGSGLAGDFWLDSEGNILIKYVEFNPSKRFKLKKSELLRVSNLNWSLTAKK